ADGGSGIYKDASIVTSANLSDLFGPATSDTAPLANQYFGTGSSVTVGAIPGDLKTDSLQVFKDGSLDTLKAGESLEIDGITYARGADTKADELTISSAYGTSDVIAGAFGAKEVNGMTAGGANMGGVVLRDVFANAGNAVQERGVMGDLLTGDLSATKVIDISNQASARAAIDFTRDSIDLVSELRATFGAVQNRFEAVISGNNTYTENLSAARSRVQDADFAQETADLAKQQVLQQAGVSVLGQANASTQSVLGLL
ncbi:MAG: hypothetical protein GX029_00720, partial [Pseudomonadaceae bacterium]|nr:hypothetical protein [Pseudomonadaceae bacterium]